ncbi:hypothetical protein [Devosia sp. 2618]|uniref:hypothetical protein n=1 Tax=Devosia sp. 2618 TaxID=3156454 RepID=UPI00339814C9
MTLHGDAAQRLRTYQRLTTRNRVVAVLRIAVPLLGLIALVGLVVQIYISSISGRFGVGQITVTSDTITVQAPRYSGVLDNGTTYTVTARAAQSVIASSELINLVDAHLVMTRPDGTIMTVDAPAAVLDTNTELVTIKDVANVSNSLGTVGTIYESVFDYQTQKLAGEGPVDIDYADGTKIIAQGITYNAVELIWTFKHATVTLPDTPGAKPQ